MSGVHPDNEPRNVHDDTVCAVWRSDDPCGCPDGHLIPEPDSLAARLDRLCQPYDENQAAS